MKFKFMAALILCLAFTGCSQKDTGTDSVSSVETASKTNMIYGSVQAEHKQDIIIDFPATVTDVNVLAGEKLNSGDAIITLDMSDYEFSIQQKQYELEQYKISLDKAEKELVSEKEQIESVKSQLNLKKDYLENKNSPTLLSIANQRTALEKKLAIDKQNYESGKILLETGGISENDYKNYEYAYKSTQSEYDNTAVSEESELTSLKLEVDELESRLNTLNANIKNTETSIASEKETLKVNIDTTQNEINNMQSKLNKEYIKDGKIVATKDGTIVSAINCEKGSSLSAESGTVIELIYSDSLYVQGEVLEDMLSDVKIGDKVDMKLAENDEGKIITGTVVQLADKAEKKDGDTIVMAKIKVDQGYEYLKSGLSVDIYLNDSNTEIKDVTKEAQGEE